MDQVGMNIAIDVRSLMHGKVSGVEVYVRNLLTELFRLDSRNCYILYYNSFHDVSHNIPHFAFSKEPLNNVVSSRNLHTSSEKRELATKTYQEKIRRGAMSILQPKCANCSSKHVVQRFPNVRLVSTRIPNKIFNLCLRYLSWPKLDSLILRRIPELTRIDLFFVPDPRPSPVSRHTLKITTFHDLSYHRYPSTFSWKTRLWHKILNPRREALQSDHLIAVSENTKQELCSYYGVSEKRVTVIPHGVSEHFGTVSLKDFIRKKYNLPDHFFLSLSTLEPRKNLSRLLQAFALLKQRKNIPHQLVIVGVENPDIFRRERLGSFDAIRFLGFVEETDKNVVYALSEGFFYVSLYEGFGLPVLEAMRCRVPVVVSDIPALCELVGEEGIVVDPLHVESIVQGMGKILNKNFVQNYKAYLFQRSQQFFWTRAAQKTLDLFSSLVCNRERKSKQSSLPVLQE